MQQTDNRKSAGEQMRRKLVFEVVGVVISNGTANHRDRAVTVCGEYLRYTTLEV
jgi:hypothetical protein